jgi:arylformamidase
MANMLTQIKYSRIVDLTVPIESRMPGIPGVPVYEKNPSRVDVVGIMNDGQRKAVAAEGLTIRDDVVVNGRSMISTFFTLVHNGTHIDAPRHALENGYPIDQTPLEQLVRKAVLITLPHKGANTTISVKDIVGTGVEFGPDVVPIIHTGWTEKMWGKAGFWEQIPYLEQGVGDFFAEKKVSAVGLDIFPEKATWRVPLDPGEVWMANHIALLEKGVAIIQFLTNMSKIGDGRFSIVALPLKIRGGDGSPARVIALVE